jgi:hypothetical protein
MRSDSILVPNGVIFTKTMNDSNDGFLFPLFLILLRITDDTNQMHASFRPLDERRHCGGVLLKTFALFFPSIFYYRQALLVRTGRFGR